MPPSGCAWRCWRPSSPRSRGWPAPTMRPAGARRDRRQGRPAAGVEPAGLVALRPSAGDQGPRAGSRGAGRHLSRAGRRPTAAHAVRQAALRLDQAADHAAREAGGARAGPAWPVLRKPRDARLSRSPGRRACRRQRAGRARGRALCRAGRLGRNRGPVRPAPARPGAGGRAAAPVAGPGRPAGGARGAGRRHPADDCQGRHGDPDEGAHRRGRRHGLAAGFRPERPAAAVSRRSGAESALQPRGAGALRARLDLQGADRRHGAGDRRRGRHDADRHAAVAPLWPAQHPRLSPHAGRHAGRGSGGQIVERRIGAAGADGRDAALQGVPGKAGVHGPERARAGRGGQERHARAAALDRPLDDHDFLRARSRRLADASGGRLCDDRQWWRARLPVAADRRARSWRAGVQRADGARDAAHHAPGRRARHGDARRSGRLRDRRQDRHGRQGAPGWRLLPRPQHLDLRGGLSDLAARIRPCRLARRADRPLRPPAGAHRGAHCGARRRRCRAPRRAGAGAAALAAGLARGYRESRVAAGASECPSRRWTAWG